MAGTVPIRGLSNRFKRKIFVIKLGPDTMLKYDSQRYGGDDGYAIFACRTYDPNNDSALTDSSNEQITDIEDTVPSRENREDPPYCIQIGEEDVNMLSVAGRPGTPDPRNRIKTFAGRRMEYWGSSTTLEEVADVINTAKVDRGNMSAADMDNDELMAMVALGLTFTESDKKKLANLLDNIYTEDDTENHDHTQNPPSSTSTRTSVPPERKEKEERTTKRANTTPVSILEGRSGTPQLGRFLDRFPGNLTTRSPAPISAPRNIPVVRDRSRVTTTRGDTSNITVRAENPGPGPDRGIQITPPEKFKGKWPGAKWIKFPWVAGNESELEDGYFWPGRDLYTVISPVSGRRIAKWNSSPSGIRESDMEDSWEAELNSSQQVYNIDWEAETSIRVGDGAPAAVPVIPTTSRPRTGSITSITSLPSTRVTDLYTTEGSASLDPLGVVLLPRGEPQAGARSNKRAKCD